MRGHYTPPATREPGLHQGEPHRRNSLGIFIMGLLGAPSWQSHTDCVRFGSQTPGIFSVALLCQSNLCSQKKLWTVIPADHSVLQLLNTYYYINLYIYMHICILVIIQIIITECEWSVSDRCSSCVLNHL